MPALGQILCLSDVVAFVSTAVQRSCFGCPHLRCATAPQGLVSLLAIISIVLRPFVMRQEANQDFELVSDLTMARFWKRTSRNIGSRGRIGLELQSSVWNDEPDC